MSYTNDELADLYERAANRIDTYGLMKGKFWPGSPRDPGFNDIINADGKPCCTIGALMIETVTPFGWCPAAAEWLSRYVLGGHAPSLSELIAWNDDPDRTKEEVVAELRAAATLAKQSTVDASSSKE